jgi:hypothetical protein
MHHQSSSGMASFLLGKFVEAHDNLSPRSIFVDIQKHSGNFLLNIALFNRLHASSMASIF